MGKRGFGEVDALLVGITVTWRYDPGATPARPLKVRYIDTEAGQATQSLHNLLLRRQRVDGGFLDRLPCAPGRAVPGRRLGGRRRDRPDRPRRKLRIPLASVSGSPGDENP